MEKWKKLAGLLAFAICLSACGGSDSSISSVVDDDTIDLMDLHGYWYPVEGIGETTSVITCLYVNALDNIWQEYDEYGDLTGYSGAVSTDGNVLSLSGVPIVGDVDIPIGDADTLVTDEGEVYWIKGYPEFKEKTSTGTFTGNWYYGGDRDSDWAVVLTVNEDGSYSKNNEEQGSYTCREFDESIGETGTTVFRQAISLDDGFMGREYYLVSDGKVLVYWADTSHGDEYFIHEDALDDEQLQTEYKLTVDSFIGDAYYLQFDRDYSLCRVWDNRTDEQEYGTWQLRGETVSISWDDGETEEAVYSIGDSKHITMKSTGETLVNPW